MKQIRPISLLAFSCIVSIGTLLLYNIPFFLYVVQHTNGSASEKVFLLISLIVIMLAVNLMMTSLLMWLLRRVGRVLLAILSIINSTAVYFIFTYSVFIDATTIENVFNTRYSEVSGFFSWGLWLFILALGVLPALYCLFQPVVIGKAKKLGIYCGGSLVIVLVIALLNINQTLWISQHDTELGGLLQPWSYVVNTCRVISFQHDEQVEEIKLLDGCIVDKEKAVVVLVIGESARKANFQLYGYKRDTNPLLSKQEGLKVYQATSCATYTTAGSKAILEPKNSDDLYELLPNYAFRTGVDVSWRTYNWGEPPIHIDEYLTDQDLADRYPDVDKRYDNTIRYTDYLLDSLINTLRSMTDRHSAMLFISDHGESLGEKGVFMHGLPMKLAPKVQYEIPFLVWTSDHFRRYKSADELPAVLEQHYVFHSVLNLLSIQSPAYDKDYDIFEIN